MNEIIVPIPELQTSFAKTLFTIRGLYLQDALRKAIEKTDIAIIDNELHIFAPGKILTELAAVGLRGELVFATPYLLKKSPYLIGYYRLLLGFSQKTFYVSRYGLSSFKLMEEKGILSPKSVNSLSELCKNLNQSASTLITGIGIDRLSANILHDLNCVVGQIINLVLQQS
jgi:hypothetical protein